MKTLKTLIADRGINEAHAVKLLNQRARYALTRDRTKVYASTPLGSIPSMFFTHDVETTAIDLSALDVGTRTGNTALYVKAWCRLNHLKD